MTDVEMLQELHGRLRHAALGLSDLINNSNGPFVRSDSEITRLQGKRAGVHLALSYVEDELRARNEVPA